jgi:hypothetical protein
MSKTWTAADILALGVRTDVETAGSIFGLSRTQAYEAHKAGRLPFPVVRAGRHLVVPVAPILELLGLDAAPSSRPAPDREAGKLRAVT